MDLQNPPVDYQDPVDYNTDLDSPQSDVEDDYDSINEDHYYQNDIYDDTDIEEAPEPTGYYELLDDLAKRWLGIHLSHNVSLSATYEFWNLAVKLMPKLNSAKINQDIKKNTPQFVHLRRKMYREMCPPVQIDTEYLRKSTNETIKIKSEKTQVKLYNSNPDYIKKCETVQIKVRNP